jgi:hypothetical protein
MHQQVLDPGIRSTNTIPHLDQVQAEVVALDTQSDFQNEIDKKLSEFTKKKRKASNLLAFPICISHGGDGNDKDPRNYPGPIFSLSISLSLL